MRCRLDFKISVGTCMWPMHEPVRRCMPHHKSDGFFGSCLLFHVLLADILLLDGNCFLKKESFLKIGDIINLFVTNCKFKKHRYRYLGLAHHRQLFHWPLVRPPTKFSPASLHSIHAPGLRYSADSYFCFSFRNRSEPCTVYAVVIRKVVDSRDIFLPSNMRERRTVVSLHV